VDDALDRLVAAAFDSGKLRLIRRFGRRSKQQPSQVGPGSPVPLTSDQAAEVCRVVREKAAVFGLSEKITDTMADAVVGALMLDAVHGHLRVRALQGGGQAEADGASSIRRCGDGVTASGTVSPTSTPSPGTE
jgi:hypothetical protein